MEPMKRKPDDELVEVFTPYITRRGKRIWHPRWFTHREVFHFWAPARRGPQT